MIEKKVSRRKFSKLIDGRWVQVKGLDLLRGDVFAVDGDYDAPFEVLRDARRRSYSKHAEIDAIPAYGKDWSVGYNGLEVIKGNESRLAHNFLGAIQGVTIYEERDE